MVKLCWYRCTTTSPNMILLLLTTTTKLLQLLLISHPSYYHRYCKHGWQTRNHATISPHQMQSSHTNHKFPVQMSTAACELFQRATSSHLLHLAPCRIHHCVCVYTWRHTIPLAAQVCSWCHCCTLPLHLQWGWVCGHGTKCTLLYCSVQ